MTAEDVLRTLRVNALSAHQTSMGHGDELVKILERAIGQLERTHTRIQAMSTILFAAGLALLAVGVAQIVVGGEGQEVWGVLLGGIGGVASLAATFWTAPLDKMSRSVSDLVKLEAAFLGYIRIIGEVDSAFQMQYLDTFVPGDHLTLDKVMNDTTARVKEMMSHTIELIDKYVVQPGGAIKGLQDQAAGFDRRLTAVEATQKK